jgi:PAS domain S-box-containing protein
MHSFRERSIRQKLTMMGILASGTAILLACTAFLTYELFAYRGDMIRSLFTQAEIVGTNSASAILFNDEPAAAETLAALKADPHIVSAGIYTRDNRAFAVYGRSDKQRAVALRERFADHADGHWFESDSLILFRKIVFKGETIGTVYIQSDLEEMNARLWQYFVIIFVVFLASSSVALFISSRLQGKLTQPLFHLVETAQTVSREKDYTIRAVTDSKDEMGILVRAFNEMLVQIQQRDAALRKSSDEMEQQVLERTAQLQHANMELAQSEERFRCVAQSANDAIISADSAERILTWNKGARKIFGYTEEEVVGKPLTILIPERYRDAHRKGLEQVRASDETGGNGSTIELHGLRKDANEFPLEISLAAWEAGGNTFYSGIVRDITERKRAEEAFHKSEEKYHTLFDSVDEGVCIIEVLFDKNEKPIDFRFLEVNPSFEKQTGIQNAQGRRMREIAPLHEEHWFEIYGKIALTGEPARFENQAAQLDRWYDVYALRVGEPQERRVAVLFKDITERKRAEETLRRAHDELEARVQERTAEIQKKNRDLETLLYVTSHDLREPLRSIENFSRMVHDRYADHLDDKGKDFLRRVVRGTQRMDQLMADILTLSRVQRMELPAEEIESESIVREALRRLDDKIKETGATVQVAKDLPQWQGNQTWATQGVYNLITNALKFTRNGEAPEVEIAPYQPTVEDGPVVGIVVRDRGPGVAPEHAERIFQLFQRAVGREVEGTGAGLAIVRQVAERHGGRAWVQPREGGGSEFILTFGTDESARKK